MDQGTVLHSFGVSKATVPPICHLQRPGKECKLLHDQVGMSKGPGGPWKQTLPAPRGVGEKWVKLRDPGEIEWGSGAEGRCQEGALPACPTTMELGDSQSEGQVEGR